MCDLEYRKGTKTLKSHTPHSNTEDAYFPSSNMCWSYKIEECLETRKPTRKEIYTLFTCTSQFLEDRLHTDYWHHNPNNIGSIDPRNSHIWPRPCNLPNKDLKPKLNSWKFPSYLSGKYRLQQLLKNIMNRIWNYKWSTQNHPILYWKTAKAFMKGKIMSYVAAYKKKIIQTYNQTSQQLRKAQLDYQTNSNINTRKEWLHSKSKFDSCQKNYEVIQHDVRDLKFHKFGNKAYKLVCLSK